jgi:enoyl-CoA hydratase
MSMKDVTEIKTAWIDFTEQGRVAEISVHRPAKINILNRQTMLELRNAFEQASAETDLRCVILTGGDDKSFIGGADITEMANLNPVTAREFITTLHNVCQAIRDCPTPVIALINGYCLGAGMEIAAACDIRVASTNAQFGMPEVLVGIPSVIEAALLPRLIGWGKTNELLLTGKIISASEAKDIHFIEQLTDVNSLEKITLDLISGILNAGPRSIATQKSLMLKWENLTPDESIQAGINAFEDAFTTKEPAEYMQRFLNR